VSVAVCATGQNHHKKMIFANGTTHCTTHCNKTEATVQDDFVSSSLHVGTHPLSLSVSPPPYPPYTTPFKSLPCLSHTISLSCLDSHFLFPNPPPPTQSYSFFYSHTHTHRFCSRISLGFTAHIAGLELGTKTHTHGHICQT